MGGPAAAGQARVRRAQRRRRSSSAPRWSAGAPRSRSGPPSTCSTAPLFGAVYANVAPALPVPPWARGPLAGLAEHLATWPLASVVDRVHPARDRIPPITGKRAAFWQAAWRHLLFGLLLGELERRLNAPEPEVPVARGRLLLQRARLAGARHPRRLVASPASWARAPSSPAPPASPGATSPTPARPPATSIVALSRAAGRRPPRRRRDPARRSPRPGPDVVYHLAAKASVGRSWQDPRRALTENVTMTLNVLEAVREEAPDAHVVVAGTGEVYGPPAELPVTEGAPLHPQNPYAVSKAAAELLAGFYADAHGRARDPHARLQPRRATPVADLRHRLVRPPGRRGAAARRRPRARRHRQPRRAPRLHRRALRGPRLPPAGRPCPGGRLQRLLGLHALDPRDRRPAGRGRRRRRRARGQPRPRARPRGHGGARRARPADRATGWEPVIPFDRTLGDAVAWWEQELAAAR